MNFNFLFVQFLGVIAWLLLIVSYYCKKTNGILVFQITATFFYCIHYYLLGAWSGLCICFLEIIRDLLYYKTDLDNYIFYGSIPFYIIYIILGSSNIVDIFPVFSSIIGGYSLTQKRDMVVVWSIIVYTLWVLYDLFVMSYSGAITDGIIVISNIIILLRENKFNRSLFLKK